jgi:hypothetical protein
MYYSERDSIRTWGSPRLYSGMWHRVVRHKFTDVSGEYTASFLRVEQWTKQGGSNKQNLLLVLFVEPKHELKQFYFSDNFDVSCCGPKGYYKTHYLILSRASLVGIATDYGLDDRGVGVRVPVGSRIFSSPRRPDRLWGPRNLLSNGYRGLSFPEGKAAGAWSCPFTSS